MLNWPPSVRIWRATRATDRRTSFATLAEVVRQQLQADPFSGHLFVFRNRRADRVKLLYWDEDGFVLIYKRLEQGSFRFPPAVAARVEIRAADLHLLLDGIDVESVRRQRRYRRPPPTPA